MKYIFLKSLVVILKPIRKTCGFWVWFHKTVWMMIWNMLVVGEGGSGVEGLTVQSYHLYFRDTGRSTQTQKRWPEKHRQGSSCRIPHDWFHSCSSMSHWSMEQMDSGQKGRSSQRPKRTEVGRDVMRRFILHLTLDRRFIPKSSKTFKLQSWFFRLHCGQFGQSINV